MKYLKVWTDFERIVSPLEDDEIGRLFLHMLHYASTGEEPTDFIGNESFLWAVAKRDIDTMAEKDEKLRQNGSKGGIAKSKNKQTLANSTKPYQSLPMVDGATEFVPNVSLKEIKRNEKKRNEMKLNEMSSTFIVDDDAAKINEEQNRVLDAAEDAGFKVSNDVRASLIALYADNGLDKMLDGFRSCVEHGVTNLAYLKAVLSGKPKKDNNPVKDFAQRDYSNEQSEAMERMMAWTAGDGA